MKQLSEARLRANKKYADSHCKSFSVQLNKSTDADIIDHLGTKKNRQGYIKDLIRRDIRG